MAWSYAELAREIDRHACDVVGITAMTFTLIDVVLTCRAIRSVRPNAKIVLGGPHVHLYPDETIRLPCVDFLIQGEGELAFVELLDALDHPRRWHAIPGLVFLENGNVVNTGIATPAHDLDALGLPARHKLDVRQYSSLLGRSDVVTTMFTSRGCPYRCTFCDRPFSPVLTGFRWRSAKHVADEMEECLRLGISEAYIYDDTFTVRRDRVLDLCDEIRSRGLQFRWDVRAHVNTVTPDLLRAMAAAGCERIHYGVECGNDRMMKVIRKNCSVSKVREAFRWTREAGMETLAYFIIGQQTETRSDIADTLDLARALAPSYTHFTIFCPYPGTQIYAEGLERGIIRRDVWQGFAEDPQPGFEIPVWEENFSRQELRELLVDCYKTFYLRPTFMLESLTRVRSFGELRRKVMAGLSLLDMSPDDRVFEDEMTRSVRELVPRSPIDVHL